jgi:hypothetical protein
MHRRKRSSATRCSSCRAARQQRAADRRARHRQVVADQGLPERLRAQGLRLIEVDKADLTDLPDIVEVVAARPEKIHRVLRRPEL